MPERRHEFRGIHDREMVRSGVEIDIEDLGQRARMTLTATRVGHRFPTYVVPRVTLTGVGLDEAGRAIPGSRRTWIIQRRVASGAGGWKEISDTRLKPGQSARVAVPWTLGKEKVQRIHFQVSIDPDHYYREEVYADLLKTMQPGPARDLIVQADREARDNRFILFDRKVEKTRENKETNP